MKYFPKEEMTFRQKTTEWINRPLVWLKSQPEQTLLMVLAFVIGSGSGIAAVILKKLIHLVGNLLTGWLDSSVDNLLLLVYPGIGMLISMLIVRYIVRDDISHGVTKALFAISKNNSQIKKHNMWSSVLTSSLTIGFGGSVGAEAPIVYTGAAIGSNVARKLGLSYRQMTILLCCGAAGAVAGIFKAPMAGILFTVEILLFNLTMSSVLPLLISSVTATTISYIFLGGDVSFHSVVDPFTLSNIPYYMILGIACGFVSLYFMRTTLFMESRIKTIKNPYTRWAMCAAGLGLLIFLFPPLFGEGYDSLIHMLEGNPGNVLEHSPLSFLFNYKWLIPIYFLLLLVFKVFAMSFTNAGGGVGGTFGPTLIVGGIAGLVVARFVNLTGFHVLPEANFALVGMAGLMAGVMQAPMTAIFLIAEITGGYSLLLPLIIVSTISFATMRWFEPYSIYSHRLAKSGDLITHNSDRAVLTLLKTGDLVEKDFITVDENASLGDLVDVVAKSHRNLFPVIDAEYIFKGFISLDDIREIMFDREKYSEIFVYNLVKNAPSVVSEEDRMDEVMKKFDQSGAWNLPVVDVEGRYVGFVSKSKIFSSYRKRLQDVSCD